MGKVPDPTESTKMTVGAVRGVCKPGVLVQTVSSNSLVNLTWLNKKSNFPSLNLISSLNLSDLT